MKSIVLPGTLRRWTAWLAMTLLALSGLACAPPREEPPPPPPAAGDAEGPPFPCPPTAITSELATVPPDLSGQIEQVNFDLYSWLAFIALNWPADVATCSADTSKSVLSGDGPVVWETYLMDTDVFVAAGDTPSPWCPDSDALFEERLSRLPEASAALARDSGARRLLVQNAKAAPAIVEKFPDITELGEVVTDQNGRFVRYEIHLNEDEYNFLVDPANKLWAQSGQTAFTGTVTFPVGPSSFGPTGAIEIKAAWKVLCEQGDTDPSCKQPDDPSRFYTVQGIVFNDAAGDPSPGTVPVTLGLVGLHIIHKTATQPSWIWSTFEHVDNAPTQGQPQPSDPHYSFNDPSCPAAECPPNTQTASKPFTELNSDATPINDPTQVERVTPILESGAACQQPDPPPSLNEVFQKLLAGSVWQNYELISTQWVGEFGTDPKPAVLANTAIETYIQSTSSCIGCHGNAHLAVDDRKADFSFLLGGAQPGT